MHLLHLRRALLAGTFLLLSSLACGPDASGSGVSVPASPAVQVLRAPPLPQRTPDALGLLRAAEAWRTSPGEASALGLARAYFPELSDGESPDPRLVPEEALRIRFPATPGEPLEVASWGHVFRILPEGLGPMRLTPGAAFSDARRFFMPSGGRALTPDGEWKTPRVEEYVVLDSGEPEYRMRYTVTLPDGVRGARDAGEYLELLDAREAPVLRLHGLIVRDATGLERRGTVQLRGATLQSVPPDGMARHALRGTLGVEMAVDLRGMTAPLVVDPGWSSTGSMASRRGEGHSVTLLNSGKVLAVGGHSGSNGVNSSAELYDPATGTWSSAGFMSTQRQYHAATLLPSGKVLVTGGFTDSYSWLKNAELYDPATNTWSVTGSMAAPRQYHAAELLPSGKVIVLGGSSTNATMLSSVEQYDPATGTWTPHGNLSRVRMGHTATLLNTGYVLVIGGSTTSGGLELRAELYAPSTGIGFAINGPTPYGHTATLLKSGKVLLAGHRFSPAAEVYDPSTGITSAAHMPSPHYFHSAAILPSGRVLVTGGMYDYQTRSSWADLYNPATSTWQTQAYLPQSRVNHKSVGLPSGQVLVVGGNNVSSLATAVLFDSGERAPVAPSLSVTTAANTPAAVTLQATDVNGDALTYQVVSSPAHGSLTGSPPNLTYVPAAGYSGPDAFTWKASDGGYESNVATVSLTVLPPNEVPVASSLAATTAEDTSVTLTLQATDADGDPLTFEIVSPPAHGTLTGSPPNLTYVPAAHFAGSDSFTWRASDGTAHSAPMTVALTVTQVNDAPVAKAFSLTLAQDTQAAATLGGTDVEGSTLTYTIVTWPLNGWLSGTPPQLTYWPVRGFYGSDSFSYRVSDGNLYSTVTVPITVTRGSSQFLRENATR